MDVMLQMTFSNALSSTEMCILIEFALEFVPRVPINTISPLVQIMVWRRTGTKPLSEPMTA